MILHFNYHIAGIFYGIDVKRPDANGTVPLSLAFIRAIFQIFPMCFCTVILCFQQRFVRQANFGLSVLYTLANIAHVIGEFLQKAELSQINLLMFVLVASLLLNYFAWLWLREEEA